MNSYRRVWNRFWVLLAAVLVAGALAQAAVTPEQLAKIKLPPGFSISVFAADVQGARSMVLSSRGHLYVGTRDQGKVYVIEDALTSATKGEKAKPAYTLARGLQMPNGVAVHGSDLIVAEISRITRYPGIDVSPRSPIKPIVLREDYPKDVHHGWKYIAIGPDGWLYVPVGAPCNRCVRDNSIYASITRLSLDGKTREVVASGIRNTVGFAWHPETQELWFTDNGADGLGDNMPGDELNRLEKPGQHFGFPFCHQGDFQDPEFGVGKNCREDGPYARPVQKLGPHVAALGMKFYTGKMFPPIYQGRVFIAEHGSWNRSQKIGYRLTTVTLDGNRAIGYETFAEGWLQNGSVWGRPADVLVLSDGSLLVSDDQAGVIYQIRYKEPQS